MRRIPLGLSIGLSLCEVAAGQERPARAPLVAPLYCPPITQTVPYCPPGTLTPLPGTLPPGSVAPLPGQPQPGTPNPNPQIPNQPNQPNPPQPSPEVPPQPRSADDDGERGFARGTRAGGLDIDRRNVNMFADVLGARSVTLTYNVPITAQFSIGGLTTTGSGGPAVLVNPNGSGSFIQFGPLPNGNQFTANSAFTNTNLSYTQPISGSAASFDRAFATAVLQSLLSNGQLTAAQVLAFQQLSPADRAQLMANRGTINNAITQATHGLAIPAVTVSGVNGTISNSNITYSAQLTGQQVIALPGASSSVGRVKMSEDNSPLPRDRFIFDYDSFGNVPYTQSGINVNRFQFGLEKTFLDGRYSAEVRLPFAGTLASTYTQGSEVTGTEFGNIRLAFKRMMFSNPLWMMSSGLAISLPTAKDQTVISPLDNSILYRFRNKSVQLEPYVAAMFTPTQRLFGQFWTSMNFDASGSDFYWNKDAFGGSGQASIFDLPILSVDGQVGYWVIQNGVGAVRGLAPFVELHWNQTIAQNTLFNSIAGSTNGYGLTVNPIGSQELNLTSGLICQVGDNMNVSVAAAVPLLQNPSRTFEWQIGVRASYFFGSTARNRTPAVAINNY